MPSLVAPPITKIWPRPWNLKIGHVWSSPYPSRDRVPSRGRLTFGIVYLCTKFNDSSFSDNKDMIRPQNLKWVTWPWPRPFERWFDIRRLGLAMVNHLPNFLLPLVTKVWKTMHNVENRVVWVVMSNWKSLEIAPFDRAPIS